MSVNTAMIAIAIAAGAGLLLGISLPYMKRNYREYIVNILVYLCACAENSLKEGTGALKLAKVYSEFTANYPALAQLVTFKEFSALVDQALARLKDMMGNPKIRSAVEGETNLN